MSSTILDSVALAYQPVWNRRRQLAAVRLSVWPVNPDSVDAAHLMQLLGDDWPVAAPVLILLGTKRDWTTDSVSRQAADARP